MKQEQMRNIAEWINRAVESNNDSSKLKEIKQEVLKLTKKFPLYPQFK
jgi:glycine hydroxymethyltransferase